MLTLASIFVVISILISLTKIVVSRQDADRVIGIDILGFQLIALSVLLAFHDDKPLALQFAFMLSLLGFISTLILARLFNPQNTDKTDPS